jgi:hypothetical protein
MAFIKTPQLQESNLCNLRVNPHPMGAAKGSLKNKFTFYTPMHLFQLRCESSEYPDIPAFSRLAERSPQRLKP